MTVRDAQGPTELTKETISINRRLKTDKEFNKDDIGTPTDTSLTCASTLMKADHAIKRPDVTAIQHIINTVLPE